MERWYDTLRVWGEWAEAVSGGPIQSGHHLAEEAPEETARELLRFFTDEKGDLTDMIGG
jgi:haloacetate dehalogenase